MAIKMGKYLCTYRPGHHRATKDGYVYTHILMAEIKLGRLLKKGEVVHHIDEDKYNNSLDNLMVFKTLADHTAFHHGVKAELIGDVWHCPTKGLSLCPICNNSKSYTAKICKICKIQTSKNNFKNKYFKKININKFDDYFRKILKDQIRCGNFTSVGKIYNVTDNAIRKWCKKYNLPTSSIIIKMIPDEEWETEILSDYTVNNINEYYIRKKISDDCIIDYYFKNPYVSKVAKYFNMDVTSVNKLLKKNNIRLLKNYESKNIKVIDIYNNEKYIKSFLTVKEAGVWILENKYNGNTNTVKNIAYKISKNLDTNNNVFGFKFYKNTNIDNYKDFLICI